MNKRVFLSIIILLIISGIVVQPSISNHGYAQVPQKKVFRLGYFPNITHGQAVIGVGNGDYQKVLGDNIELKTFTFNAGP
ncbi:MAG: sulfate ABC transporter substrate-binding protein, partial [Nitrososphaeraceae archaeon]